MTLTVTGVKDLAGNAVPTSTTHFTTSAAPEWVTPVIITTNPPNGATNVPVNAAIAVQTNAVIDVTTATPSTFRVNDNTTGQNVAGTYSLSADGMTVYFLPSAPLATGRTYTINVNSASAGLTDVLGNLLHWCCGLTFSFTTGVAPSTTGPQMTAVSPANGLTQVPLNALIMIQFNEPVDVQTLGKVTLSASSGPVPVLTGLSNGNQTFINLMPLIILQPNAQYTLNISGVTDLSGVSAITPVATNFTTGSTVDFSVPQVSGAIPANGATGVPTTSSVQIQFTKTMNPLTISTSTFTVASNGSPLGGTILVASDGRSITFTPAVSLSPVTDYVVTINSGIVDLGGLAVTSFQSTFTTSN